MKKICLVGVFAGSMFLAGCNTPAIYYEDWYNPPVHWGHHTVRKDETLYKIAWRYGRDYRELGDANGLSHPYTIREGQTIRLDLKGQIPVDSMEVASNSSSEKKGGATVFVTDPDSQESVPVKADKDNPPRKQINVPEVATNLKWGWPHDGEIVRGFSTKGMSVKGIDIKGSRGDSISAAANGHVVYSGSGILGYGNMIIIGHDKKTFSVYAHNSKLLVSEGDAVEKGQKISEMGDSGADKVKLYFEIRKNGKSVDPINDLPKRG